MHVSQRLAMGTEYAYGCINVGQPLGIICMAAEPCLGPQRHMYSEQGLGYYRLQLQNVNEFMYMHAMAPGLHAAN